MADSQNIEGSSSHGAFDESSESTVELNVKTLDSKIYSFHVNKNITVSAFKEKIASQTGLSVNQQRLIFRGKVLKDEHLLSEYHVENGHTLHLVERQPSQSQSSSADSTGPLNTNNGSRGQQPGAGGPHGRIGQISHSVVLGALNVGDQGEGIVPDLSRIVGAVVNSIVGNQIGGMQPAVQFNTQAPTTLVNETEGARGNTGNQSRTANQSRQGQTLPGSFPHAVQIPVGAAIAIPAVNTPIPNSLSTLVEFMNRMEQVFTQNADHSNQSPSNHGNSPRVELPQNSRGVATPEGLSIVLRQAERLTAAQAVAALSHIAGRLEREAGSADPTVRGQMQTESVQLGLAMQHLGALFLELGRTILTLHMGQSPAESFLNAGPAVYISPSGPNPIMVQPFPLQTSSLFNSSAPPSTNSGVFGPIGIGNIPRNVNIHIHAVGTRSTNVEGSQGERNSGSGSNDSSLTQALPVRNVIGTAISSQPSVVSLSGGPQPGSADSQSHSFSNIVSELNARIRNRVDNMQNQEQTSSDHSGTSSVEVQNVGSHTGERDSNDRRDSTAVEEDKKQIQCAQPCSIESTGGLINSKEEASTSSAQGSRELSGTFAASANGLDTSNPDGPSATPIGLGLGGLQPKRRTRPSRSQSGRTDGAATSNQELSRMIGQKVLQSLASLQSQPNPDTPPSGFPSHSRGPDVGDQIDVANAMSQMLQSPALGGLLTGVSQQTGIGSPNVLRSMMEQLTCNPAMRNTVNQIAEQIDSHDLGSMLSGSAGSRGGNIDLSSMIQQMLPIVSQALGGAAATVPQSTPAAESELQQSPSRRGLLQARANPQVDLRQIAQRIELQSLPGEIFGAMLEGTAQSYDNNSSSENIVNELCSDDSLANEFMEMLSQDVSRRLGRSTQ